MVREELSITWTLASRPENILFIEGIELGLTGVQVVFLGLFKDRNIQIAGSKRTTKYRRNTPLWSTVVGLSTDPAPLIMSNFFRFRVLWS